MTGSPERRPNGSGPGTGSPRRVAVLGYMVRGPLGGLAWHHLQYLVGLARLGHEVLFVEDSDDYPSCVHLNGDPLNDDPEEGLAFTADALERFGLGERFAYWDAHRDRWRGPAGDDAEAFCRSADVVLNISGVNPVRPWWAEAPIRVLIDTDPAFVQVRHIHSEQARALAEAHNAFFTFAEKIDDGDCGVPDDGLPWRPTRQPVVLEAWPVSPPPTDGAFTTVMQWDSYDALEYEGVRYGMKSAAFADYMALPSKVDARLELGLGGASRAPVAELRGGGWSIRNTLEFTRTPWDYQAFIRDSLGEFSIAKQGYVVSRSGWFSERSANYLASGRPVVVQDTGFSDVLPVGEGLMAFNSPDEAAAQIEAVMGDLSRHSAAARRIAEQHFDASTVLEHLLTEAEQVTGEAWSR